MWSLKTSLTAPVPKTYCSAVCAKHGTGEMTGVAVLLGLTLALASGLAGPQGDDALDFQRHCEYITLQLLTELTMF